MGPRAPVPAASLEDLPGSSLRPPRDTFEAIVAIVAIVAVLAIVAIVAIIAIIAIVARLAIGGAPHGQLPYGGTQAASTALTLLTFSSERGAFFCPSNSRGSRSMGSPSILSGGRAAHGDGLPSQSVPPYPEHASGDTLATGDTPRLGDRPAPPRSSRSGAPAPTPVPRTRAGRARTRAQSATVALGPLHRAPSRASRFRPADARPVQSGSSLPTVLPPDFGPRSREQVFASGVRLRKQEHPLR